MSIAMEIVKSSFIGDAHLDLAYDIVRKKEQGFSRILINDYLEDIQAGGINLIISSIFIDDQFVPQMSLRRGITQVEALLEDVEECSEYFTFCTNYDQIVKAYNNNKVAIMLSFEGLEPIYDDIVLLRLFYRLGVRGLGLTWSRRNNICDGSNFSSQRSGTIGGLTTYALDVLDYALEKNMYVDLSHINDIGFADTFDNFNGAIMVSHTNCRALNETMRNISDTQIECVIKSNGFIGINSMNFALSDGKSVTEDLKGYCDHIDYVVQRGGLNNVGMGFDFNDQIIQYVPVVQLKKLTRKPFDCIKGYKDVPFIIEELLSRGYEVEDIKRIIGRNLLEFIKRI